MNPHLIGYVISCLPDNALRQERLRLHNQQLNEWVERTDIPLVVAAMGYRSDEYRHDLASRVSYIELPAPVPPAEARNVCLQNFYASGYRWAALMDNDAVLYHGQTYNSGYDFIQEMTTHIDLYNDIGLFYPINPVQMPFRQRWEDADYQTHHVFERGFSAKGTLVFVRNFTQSGHQPVFQDTAFTFMEDNAFAFDVLSAGHGVFQNWNMVVKELVPAGPLSFFGDAQSRGPRGHAARQQMVAKFAADGLDMSAQGSLNTRKMVNQCWPRGVGRVNYIPKP